ncbi:FkbM family methyltransferase [Legionella yabuuchiae]|uniref:FkbM family methyltransferase n=1 Tax=Legionella yabuuchiae TaxID=376727 RepID=UPI0013EF89E7|nr:FkbM family methyltransferase [Legionella yabuuchiae]
MYTKSQLEFIHKCAKDNKISSLENDYPIQPFIHDIKTILDAGAHIGTTAIYFQQYYPKAHIYAYEPDPDIFKILKETTKKYNNIHCYQVGLSNKNSESTLFQSPDLLWNLWGTIKKEHYNNELDKNDLGEAIEKKVIIVNSSLTLAVNDIEYYDLIKLDTQGCEYEILLSLKDTLVNTSLIYLEYHCQEDDERIALILRDTHRLYQKNEKRKGRGVQLFVNNKIKRPFML